jgi:hypothetical protein
MYTWLVKLTLGLTGVLSTRDHGVSLGSDDCGGVNSIAQKSVEPAVLAQSKFGIKTFRKMHLAAYCIVFAAVRGA